MLSDETQDLADDDRSVDDGALRNVTPVALVAREHSSYRRPAACDRSGLVAILILGAIAITLTTWRWVEPRSISSARPSPRLAVFDVAPAAPDPAPQRLQQEPRPPSKPEAILPQIASPPPVVPNHTNTAAAAPIRPAPPAPLGIAIVNLPAPAPPIASPAPAIRPVTASSPASEKSARANWQGDLLAHLKPLLRYPRMALGTGQQGVTLVAVAVERSGAIRSIRIAHGSGYPVLDQEAVATVKRGVPLPPPTADIPGDPVAVELPIQFSLRG